MRFYIGGTDRVREADSSSEEVMIELGAQKLSRLTRQIREGRAL